MDVVFAGITPHPPLLVPEVGGGELRKVAGTAKALKDLSNRVLTSGAERLIIITPHGPAMRDAVTVFKEGTLIGDFGKFGARDISLSFETDKDLSYSLKEELKKTDIKTEFLSYSHGIEMDHGAGVPLYYLKNEGVDLPGLYITPGFLSYDTLFAFGKILRKAVSLSGYKTAIIASGDLSHRLIPGAPAGYDPKGKEFDKKLVELLAEYRVSDILNFDAETVECAGECGLRSFVIMLGFLEGSKVSPEIISYEGPFGVGYLVASFKVEKKAEKLNNIIPEIARKSIQKRLNKKTEDLVAERIPPELKETRGGVFVSLKKGGMLRGCIGTVEPFYDNLLEEIKANAVSAGFRDPRFPPLKESELEDVDISVDILSPMEPVNNLNELDPRKYGIVLRSGGRSGLLLPDLEGVDTVEEQVSITLQKAGILPHQNYDIYRFTVTRYPDTD